MTDQTEAAVTRPREADPVDEPGSLLPDGLHSVADRSWRRSPPLISPTASGVGVVGSAVLIVGIIMIPYPGPGCSSCSPVWASSRPSSPGPTAYSGSRAPSTTRSPTGSRRSTGRAVAVRAVQRFAIVLADAVDLGALKLAAGWVGIDWSWLASPLF